MAKEKTSDKTAPRLSWVEIAAIWVIVALVVFAFRDVLAECVGYAATIEGDMNRGARFFRDFMVGFSALTGIVIAAWRSSVLERQSKTAENRLLNERFGTAAELMGKETAGNNPRPVIAARISGIYAIGDLAIRAPKDFAEQVVKSLIAYIKDNAVETARKPSQTVPEEIPEDEVRKWLMLGEDVKSAFAVLYRILSDSQAIVEISGDILDFSHQHFTKLDFSDRQVKIIHYKNWRDTNFRGALFVKAAFCKGVLLEEADFYNAVLSSATLVEANLSHANLQKAILRGADLRGADMWHALCHGAYLDEAKMHGSDLSELEGHIFEHQGKKACCLNRANLQGAKLAAADLRGAKMRWVDLRGADLTCADLRGADLSGAKFGETNMTGVHIDSHALSGDVKKAMNGKIWYAWDDEWARDITENADNPTWDLELYSDGYALAGIARNFVGGPDDKFGGENLQRQARKLLDEEKVPPEHVANVRKYLKKA